MYTYRISCILPKIYIYIYTYIYIYISWMRTNSSRLGTLLKSMIIGSGLRYMGSYGFRSQNSDLRF